MPPWSSSPMVMPTPQTTGKRKLDDADAEDPHQKIRRVVRNHVLQDPGRVVPMTTVVCLHAAVAQKSYGSEKRFLCPPPVVHIEGPVWQMRNQQLSMAVVSEDGTRSFEQKAPLDNNMTASFKFLHVTGTAKAKSFQLSLDIAEPPPPSLTPEGGEPPSGRTWASFDSAPVTIISKPSKKTAKTRNISSCILAGGPVSLFNRINSQTVRTKYMTIDHGSLCGPQPVTYGSEVILSDTNSGISTSPLLIRKVDKGRIIADDGGPVSQMQKIALQRVNPDGSRHYLSAAGPMPGTPGVVAPPAPGMSQQAGTHPLVFSSPRIRDELKDGVRVISDEVDDYLCWTIVGISKFQYTFFDAFGQNSNIPEMPITPFPTLFTAPTYRHQNRSMDLTVSNFFYEHPKTRMQTPLDVYLGNLGPLRQRVYQATPPGPLTAISPFVHTLTPSHPPQPPHPPMLPQDGSSSSEPIFVAPPRFIPSGPVHTIVVVEMPPIPEIIKALEEDAAPPKSDDNQRAGDSSSGPSNDRPVGPLSAQISGRSLPLLFIRSYDGVGYHSGRTVTVENIFQSIDIGGLTNGSNGSGAQMDSNWLAAAQAVEGSTHGWALRVL
ncbi:hypothetical protein GLOTRDRAFT_52937 [Gloeophyllum trabeum ATCC 11539]|uniref:Beta-trefoil n=1 Tax=Gloeophyllum trabeum (strain ATCC 11539 / FP-39264 / Madison 617) TaxID=670483 RepID=S7S428_GLOTA|nr:uncharacterized protein GLOTRDRAFT_52937 [Gloeophyllum trabeum ATCC 11539]EPQ60609.1 hypothetical protein GLOTRDRAFT_52937 [Gloeophyllum trabeum ATCC 11539]